MKSRNADAAGAGYVVSGECSFSAAMADGSLFSERVHAEDETSAHLDSAMRDLLEAHRVGGDTLEEMGRQGEQIARIQESVSRIHAHLDLSEQRIKQLESGFAFFRKKVKTKIGPAAVSAAPFSPRLLRPPHTPRHPAQGADSFATPYDVRGILYKRSD